MKDETLGEALTKAKEEYEQAELRFLELAREANERGASLRDIADTVGMNHQTLWRWMGGGRRKVKPLDQRR